MKYLYWIYQLFIAIPLTVLLTIFFSILTMIGCAFGNGKFWGYFPLRYWSRMVLKLFLLPVKSFSIAGRSKAIPVGALGLAMMTIFPQSA